jgi:hypothetical protein
METIIVPDLLITGGDCPKCDSSVLDVGDHYSELYLLDDTSLRCPKCPIKIDSEFMEMYGVMMYNALFDEARAKGITALILPNPVPVRLIRVNKVTKFEISLNSMMGSLIVPLKIRHPFKIK